MIILSTQRSDRLYGFKLFCTAVYHDSIFVPGKLTDESCNVASFCAQISAFHLFDSTDVILPTTKSPTSPMYLKFSIPWYRVSQGYFDRPMKECNQDSSRITNGCPKDHSNSHLDFTGLTVISLSILSICPATQDKSWYPSTLSKMKEPWPLKNDFSEVMNCPGVTKLESVKSVIRSCECY